MNKSKRTSYFDKIMHVCKPSNIDIEDTLLMKSIKFHNMESGGQTGPVKMNISQDKQSMAFIPTQNVTYVFIVEGIDNNGSASLESVQVNVGP